MAPEIGEDDGPQRMHSPMRADEWSCGHVLRSACLRRDICRERGTVFLEIPSVVFLIDLKV
jgi:hypothetical protein